jgi:hypothetical protein
VRKAALLLGRCLGLSFMALPAFADSIGPNCGCPSSKCRDERDSLAGWLLGTDSLIGSPGSDFRL